MVVGLLDHEFVVLHKEKKDFMLKQFIKGYFQLVGWNLVYWLEPLCSKKRQKSPNQKTGLGKLLNDIGPK